MPSSWTAAGIALATLAGVQQVRTPPAAPPAAPAGDGADTDLANRAALSAATAQTSRIRRSLDASAADLAEYARARVRYAREMEAFGAAKAAVARKTAADAAAYERRLAEWSRQKEVVVRAPRPARVASGAAGAPSKVVCVTEAPTGSMMAVRRCRTVAQTDADTANAKHDLDSTARSGGIRIVNLP